MILFVPGTPRPQGSHRAFVMRGRDGKHHARVTSDNPKLKPWRHAVAEAALALRAQCLGPHEAVRLLAVFALRRPKSHYGKTGLNALGRSRPYPTSKPDADKCTRAIGDALKGIAYHDDACVVDPLGAKRWTELAEGAYLAVVDPDHSWNHPCDMLAQWGVMDEGGTLTGKPHGVETLSHSELVRMPL